MQPTECEEISGRTQAGDLSKSDSGDVGPMAEFFSLMDIGEVHLNCRQVNGRDGISDCNTGVGIGGWVNDNAVVSPPSLLNPGNQLALAIRLALSDL